MNRLPIERRALILRCLTDGCSMRATNRITGHARNTIGKLLVDVGGACESYQKHLFRNLACKRIETDELWAFCGCKQRSVHRGKRGEGHVWTWVALCSDTKLVPSWFVGGHSDEHARAFMNDLASRLTDRPQLTTDGHRSYPEAVLSAFGLKVDYGVLEKHYKGNHYVGSSRRRMCGWPDLTLISTSYVERQNLTMRMNMRRFTRRTNGFSKKLANLKQAIALHFMHYNFSRVHLTLGSTPAMAAGLAIRAWSLADIAALT